jgi:hypothetical protein
MKKFLLINLFLIGGYTCTYAQFTICDHCGEQRQGNKIVIEGAGKGNWTVKYNLFGHSTTFIAQNGDKITLKSDGTKTEKDGLTIRQTTSEDAQWNAEVVYKGHDFVKATLIKK